MTSAVKRSYPFGSRPSSLVEDTNQFKVPKVPLHKKMSMAPPSINVSVDGSTSSWKFSNRTTTTTTFTKQDNFNNLTITANNNTDQNGSPSEKSPLPSPPSSKGRRNMKNLQLVVPPVRSSISAPSSPQLPPNSTTHTHNRRPSTPICVYQNKGLNVADPMALMSKTENAIGEDLPYKDEPIQILPNLYLGSELNAANRSMLNGINVEFILNVGKEVENPYLEEITNANSFNLISPALPTSSSISSEDSFSTAIQSPLNSSMQLDSPIVPPSPFGTLRSNSLQKRVSMPTHTSSTSSTSSMSLQFAHGAMLSGIPLTVPATSEFKPIKYRKFFWTHNQENLIADFMSAFAFIDEARSAGKNILVHCQCGVSRSASLIIGYVMKANKMTLNQAYEFVKDRSPYISPNMSLVYQLVEFEKTLRLGNNNNSNNALPSTPTHGKGDLKRTHSRSSSIESELLLTSHRRSNSLSRGNLSNGSNNSYSPPKTPLLPPEGLLTIPQQHQQQQTTVKGGAGRFHVITASITPVSPSSLSPASSVSPTSTGSPTTPSSETSSPTTNARRFSRPSPSSPSKKSNSMLTTLKSSSQSPLSSIDRTPLSPKEIVNTSPKIASGSKTAVINANNPSTSKDVDPFASFDSFRNSFDSSQASNISFHSYDITTCIVNQNSHEVLSGPNSGIFSRSTLDSIFSPTRVSPPVTPVTIPDLFADNE